MTSLDFNNISPRDKAVLMGIFLSKFDRKALEIFGFDGFGQAFNTLGYSIGIPPRSVKNYRDEFDPYFSRIWASSQDVNWDDIARELEERLFS